MKKISIMKKLTAMGMSAAVAVSLAACTPAPAAEKPAADNTQGAEANDQQEGSQETSAQKFTVGICQLVQHEALDAATTGFKDVLLEEFGENVSFDEQNAAGDSAQCVTICTGFAANNVDLILGNATPALQAAASSTSEIPVLGTSITEYGVALDIDDFTGTVGGNISGTSDLAPLDQQADMISELLPDAQNVGILYCSAEANSVYQAETVKSSLEAKGLNVAVYTFSDSNDVASVTETACAASDVLYIPTDNTAASCTEAINNVALPAGVPIVCGEEGMCKGCGIATLSIDYYELGRTTGNMAVRILKGESNISEMPVEYYTNPTKKYNADLCSQLGITVPEEYEAISND